MSDTPARQAAIDPRDAIAGELLAELDAAITPIGPIDRLELVLLLELAGVGLVDIVAVEAAIAAAGAPPRRH